MTEIPTHLHHTYHRDGAHLRQLLYKLDSGGGPY